MDIVASTTSQTAFWDTKRKSFRFASRKRGALGSIWELLLSEVTYTMSGHINDLEHHVLGLDLSCSDLRWQNKAVNILRVDEGASAIST